MASLASCMLCMMAMCAAWCAPIARSTGSAIDRRGNVGLSGRWRTMATKAPTTCNRPGCAGLVRNGVCSACGPRRTHRNRQHDEQRGSAAHRGYDRRWRRVRLMQLRQYPLCTDCNAAGRVTAATEVHHIIAVRDGGTNEQSNLLSLCKSCHSTRTNRGE